MQSRIVTKYTLLGIAFGLAFPLVAWTLDIFLSGLTLSPAAFILIHQNNPIHYIVDLAPFVLGIAFYFLGAAYQLAFDRNHYSNLIDEDLTSETTRLKLVTSIVVLVTLIFIFIGIDSNSEQQDASHDEPIKVGILHSLTGTMAISESSVVDATQMAIDEINASGGLLGRHLETVVVDGKSDWPSFASGIETLIQQEKVSVLFGCWTSASRKLVKSIVEQYDHLLFYPVQYEGLEQSPNIIYTGATPNQQISPAVKWSMEHLGKRVYLAASDYVFPRAANTLIKKQLLALGAEVVGEYYLLLGSDDVSELIDDIANSQADVILNTINGDSNLAFFQKLHNKEIETPVMSFSIAEEEIQQMDIEVMVGHYSAWNYFQSLDTPENHRFVTNFKKRYGANRTTNASMEAAYIGVHLWAKSVIHAKTIDTSTVRQSLKGESYLAPEGKVTISALNNHLWKPLHIGQIQADGQFKIIWSQTEPIRPLPYPSYRTRQSWHRYLESLYKSWGNSWAAPISDRQDSEVAL
jgi:urea transport system substrate-binding protein